MEFPRISLKAVRVNAGLSQKIAAAALAISPATLHSYENGHTVPDWDMVHRIEELYKFPAEFIFFGKSSLKARKSNLPPTPRGRAGGKS
jgi:hypothetical protein